MGTLLEREPAKQAPESSRKPVNVYFTRIPKDSSDQTRVGSYGGDSGVLRGPWQAPGARAESRKWWRAAAHPVGSYLLIPEVSTGFRKGEKRCPLPPCLTPELRVLKAGQGALEGQA